jgi:hypothetical protein
VENTERLIGILDSEEENRRLELVLETDGDGTDRTTRLALRLAMYAEGLGWHTQKTIYIDAQQAEQMQFLLGGARHLMKQAAKNSKSEELPRASRVVEFEHPARKSA